MGQINDRLRRAQHGYGHYCPGCEGMHIIPDTWEFDGNLDKPTFSPSVKIEYNDRDAGTRRLPGPGRSPYRTCHYFLRAGELRFCGDSTHPLSGKTVPLPPLPDWLRDDWS